MEKIEWQGLTVEAEEVSYGTYVNLERGIIFVRVVRALVAEYGHVHPDSSPSMPFLMGLAIGRCVKAAMERHDKQEFSTIALV